MTLGADPGVSWKGYKIDASTPGCSKTFFWNGSSDESLKGHSERFNSSFYGHYKMTSFEHENYYDINMITDKIFLTIFKIFGMLFY